MRESVGKRQRDKRSDLVRNMDLTTLIMAGVSAGSCIVAAPFVLGAVGFTTAGIAAGSVAAKMMGAAAVANGGGVAAGGLVAVLQSAGAAGLSTVANAAVAAGGAAAGALIPH
ncbi:interferon alpha-inducible protein 27-like protein 2A [Rhinoraja longicauda]